MAKVESITIGKQQSYLLLILTFPLLILGSSVFRSTTGSNVGLLNPWQFVAILVVTVIAHEFLHGVGFRLAGAKPKYGVGNSGIMPYAYATADAKVSIPGMLVAAYAPFVILSVFFIAIAKIFPEYQVYASAGFLFNFVGAVGDLWLSSKLWKYLPNRDAVALDTKDGIYIYGTSKSAVAKGKRATKRQAKSQFTNRWIATTSAIIAFQLATPIVMTLLGFEGDFIMGTKDFNLFELHNGGASTSYSFNI